MTKEELIEREAKVRRRCRGKMKDGVREAINAKLLEATQAATQEEREAKLRDAQSLDASGRVRCGYDMNEIFLKGELDGQRHSYKCPKCGVEGTYIAAGPVVEG